MKDEITEALGLPDITPAFSFARVRQQILTDNFVYNSVLATLVEEHAPAVLSKMHPLSRKRLREKLGYPDPTAPANLTAWTIQEVVRTGQSFVQASCPRCKHVGNFSGPWPWVEHKKDARSEQFIPHEVTQKDVEHALARLAFVHCGRTETCPPHFLEMARAEFMKTVKQ